MLAIIKIFINGLLSGARTDLAIGNTYEKNQHLAPDSYAVDKADIFL